MNGSQVRSLVVVRAQARPILVAAARLRAGSARLRERLLWGGQGRERLLIGALRRHYASVLRRQWVLSDSQPHFFDHRHGAFDLLVGERHPFGFTRGFLAAELIRAGDHVLDIGCGDGFFARRFFAGRGAQVDAIDVDPEAIRHAQLLNPHPRVRYELLDATDRPFPASQYDVVVWDGALGHFARETTDAMLRKIADVLTLGGAFAGSEALAEDGHDHLQSFESADELIGLLSGAFAIVEVRTVDYPLPDGRVRREAYWRCAHEPARLDAAGWTRSLRQPVV
jgi:SAM-dependent methyltransferase